MHLSRREFLKVAAATSVLTVELSAIEDAVAGTGNIPVIWLDGQACTGCSVSFLNSIYYATVDDLLLNTIDLEYHNTVMAAAGDMAMTAANAASPSQTQMIAFANEWLSTGGGLKFDLDKNNVTNLLDFALMAKRGFVLVVEGAIPTGASGPFCTIGDSPMLDVLKAFASQAGTILAVGTCASFGGISAGAPNVTGAKGVKDALTLLGINKPVINIPGCPVHPDWIVGTISYLLVNGQAPPLDSNSRPTAYYGTPMHASCPNLSDYNSKYSSIHHNNGQNCLSCHTKTDSRVPDPKTLGMSGCLFAMGCKGIVTGCDCPSRGWNSPAQNTPGVNWCVAAKAPCTGCTQPNFPDGMSPFYRLNGPGIG